MAPKLPKGPQNMMQPLKLMFTHFQNKTRVQVRLHKKSNLRIEGHIIKFDPQLNLVLENVEEYVIDKKTWRPLGNVSIRGDHICVIQIRS